MNGKKEKCIKRKMKTLKLNQKNYFKKMNDLFKKELLFRQCWIKMLHQIKYLTKKSQQRQIHKF